MATQHQKADFHRRCEQLRARLADPDFLANKGLGNEAGIYLLCYDPSLELAARAFARGLKADCDAGRLGAPGLPARLVERNLYDAVLDILDAKRVLDRMPQQERRRGQAGVLRQVARVAPPERVVQQIDWQPHRPGEVLLIDGVGEAYPFVRLHEVLSAAQVPLRDVPVVALYPGSFDGGSLCLFGRLGDANYYRAFDLV